MHDHYQRNEENISLKLWVVLSKAHRTVADCVNEDIVSHGLNPTEFAVLELLFHKGDQPIQHIGKKILLSSGSMTYVVDQLEKKGFLERKSCSKDRRVTYVTITADGKELMASIFPKHREAIEAMFTSLDDNEKQTLIELLKKLGINLQR